MSDGANMGGIARALLELCQSSGARGGWLQKGSHMIETNLAASDERVVEMAEKINTLLVSYEDVDRSVDSLFFAFRKGHVLIISEGDLRVALWVDSQFEDATEVGLQCRRFLREQREAVIALVPLASPPVPESLPPPKMVCNGGWKSFGPVLHDLMGRAVGKTSAERLVEGVLATRGYPGGPPDKEVALVALEVLTKVPHQGFQRNLVSEAEGHLRRSGLL